MSPINLVKNPKKMFGEGRPIRKKTKKSTHKKNVKGDWMNLLPIAFKVGPLIFFYRQFSHLTAPFWATVVTLCSV